MCNLNLQTGNVEYTEFFKPINYFHRYPHPPYDDNPNLYFLNMNIISWNTRGAGNSDFRKAFRDMTRTYKPDLYILIDTRLSGDRATFAISSLSYERYMKVDALGFIGGIWVLWNPSNMIIEPITIAFHEIYLKLQVNSFTFLLTAIYTPPNFYHRKQLWEELSYLSNFIPIPWLVIGDFNDISMASEQFGGHPPSQQKMNTFNNFLNKENLLDLGFSGPKYTWTNCRERDSIIRTRIDRAYATASWLALFSDAKITHLPRLTLDHCPILLKTILETVRGPRLFRFEFFWMNHPTFQNETNYIWNMTHLNLEQIIHDYQTALKNWNKNILKNIFKEINRTKARLTGVQNHLNPITAQISLLLKNSFKHTLKNY